jgi:hypothetical protein
MALEDGALDKKQEFGFCLETSATGLNEISQIWENCFPKMTYEVPKFRF